MPTPTTPSRQPGRPRSQEADDAILRAALELLGEHMTVTAVSVGAIAQRAGVSKATIYRRWPGKVELYTDAVARLRQPLPAVDTGSVREDLTILITVICSELDNPLEHAVDLLMMGGAHPDIAERVRQHVFAPRTDTVAEVLRRGVDNGELRSDIDLDVAFMLLFGGVHMYRRVGTTLTPHQRAQRLVDTMLAGVSTD
ncbi:TetR/AcrR family transcriptional regulator [Spiractinospora alimapuensis]|uniref:TetR/AcrR family transcriptional regulator n=1 Tax=Spiractinospora alimapuensis TaxID=2820884 RepID=UPI001F2870F2|nr:TetR/AcrR family transcriptional regulator [Spiractinospora alimapuensis]QVQ53301.1 TetR/AcrR family transcriptional regulator [Spiractinospora alimapuensis]